MKLTMLDLKMGQEPLQELAGMKLRPNPAFWLARVIREANKELQTFEEKRVELIKRHGQEDESGGWNVTPANTDQFQADFNELLKAEIELNVPQRPASHLGEIEIEPGKLAALWFLFIDE